MRTNTQVVSRRSVVTVLFSDVVGFSALGERLDPESLGELMSRYFVEMQEVIQRHGGTVEKFIGDAIMAVFGVPSVHEDDALRAVRAADEMREALHGLNEQLDRMWGVRVSTRMGVNTGEVIARNPADTRSLVTGDTVNVAARLEQAAEPGQILIGDSTYRLVRDAVVAEWVGPLAVKGRAEPVATWRLLKVTARSPGWARRLDSTLIGRTDEMRLLQGAFQRAVQQPGCELVTVMGPAGVGKSRLVNELLATLAGTATVAAGRCPAYGEGITFSPIAEVLRHIAAITDLDSQSDAIARVLNLVEPTEDAPLIGERVAAILGLSELTLGIQESFWAIRKLFEQVAARSPLVLVFDDIHWGEPTFLDLLEYLADWIHGRPVTLICLARPQLLEIREGWVAARPNRSLLTVRTLSEDEIGSLIENLIPGAGLGVKARARIADVAEGNPLFAEETVRMLVDDGLIRFRENDWAVTGDLSNLTVPPTIHALLTARLDRLEPEERAAIERASVIGRVFWWGAVSELSSPEQRPGVGGALQSLVRKELVRPDDSELTAEVAFRFMHILTREAAYSGIPKGIRGELHERFAGWIETKGRVPGGEYEEIVGYHLEQAFKLRSGLGEIDERARTLGRRAAAALASSGTRAFARGDMPAAVNLLSRAVALTGADDAARLELLSELAFALLETGELTALKEVIAETTRAASGSAPSLEADALILNLRARMFTDPEGWAEEAYREATRAIATFEGENDERGLSRAWALLGLFHLMKCRFAMAEEAWEKASSYASRAGDQRHALEYLAWVPLMAGAGPRPVEEGIQVCEEALERGASDRKTMSTALFTQGSLEAMRGRFEEARELIARGRSMLQDVALTVWMAGPMTQTSGWTELLAGDPEAAERHLRWGVDTLREAGELSWLSTTAAILAEALYEQDRFEEAEEFLRVSHECGGSDDLYSQSLLRSVRAKISARRGGVEEAVRLADEAVAITQSTDFLFLQARALMSLAEVLQVTGQTERADVAVAAALQVCEHKQYVVGAEKARLLLEQRPA